MTDAFIGLGSNLGDRAAKLATALGEIEALPGTRVVAVSHAYASEPSGRVEQPEFVNAVARIRTDMAADALLEGLQDIEQRLGRPKMHRPSEPRSIDLDILLFGDEEWDSERLTIPHPRMLEREFVMRPLLEVAPRVRMPSGEAPDSSRATEGRIIADLGPVCEGYPFLVPRKDGRTVDETPSDFEDEPGVEDAAALEEATRCANRDERPFGADESWGCEDWVPVATGWGANFEVDQKLAILHDAGIPAEASTRPYSEKIGLFLGSFLPVQVLVPASRAEEARAVLEGTPGAL